MSRAEVFSLEEGRIACRISELDITHADAFHDSLDRLLRERDGEIRVDLSSCQFLSTVFLGILLATAARCKSENRRFTLLVSPRIRRYLDTGSLGDALRYECAETGRAASAHAG
jgi:anti-anti-sigma factor